MKRCSTSVEFTGSPLTRDSAGSGEERKSWVFPGRSEHPSPFFFFDSVNPSKSRETRQKIYTNLQQNNPFINIASTDKFTCGEIHLVRKRFRVVLTTLITLHDIQ